MSDFRLSLRFPDGLRPRIKASAAVNNRSMHSEILYRLHGNYSVDNVEGIHSWRHSRNADQTILRLPADLHAALVASAFGKGRSLNAECVWRLLASYAPAATDDRCAESEPLRLVRSARQDRDQLVRLRTKLVQVLAELDGMIDDGAAA